MPVTPEDRPLDALREDTIDQLVMNYGHGVLSLDAFQRRLDQAYEATRHDQLTALTDDLELPVDAGYTARKREELGASNAPAADAGEVDHVISILGGSERTGEWQAAERIRVVDVLGGVRLDFSSARFTAPTVRLQLFCLLGGVDVFVPAGVGVTVRTVNVLGGSHNRAADARDRDAPRIVIEGLVLLGGVNVKVKKTPRERVLEFADHLRTLVGRSPEVR